MNTLYGSKRRCLDGWLEAIVRTSESEITAAMIAEFSEEYGYLEIQDRDVDENGEYDVLDSWSDE